MEPPRFRIVQEVNECNLEVYRETDRCLAILPLKSAMGAAGARSRVERIDVQGVSRSISKGTLSANMAESSQTPNPY